MTHRSLLLCALLTAGALRAQEPMSSLVPLPVRVFPAEGSFTLDAASTIAVGQRELTDEGEFLHDGIQALLGFAPTLLPAAKGKTIWLSIAVSDSIPAEGYTLAIAPERIDIVGADEAGVFHGITSLLNMMRLGDKASPGIACRTISDFPRFAWRGMHLDVCRHFFPVPFVKKYIGLLARYKMNTFHWHLTDDQGWRIAIKKYPKLTETGAWRNGSQYGPYSQRTYDTLRYGGFYTQDEIREVVAYAAARHITVVPEIEMPGHAMAALASYPELGCTGGTYEVQKGWGVFDDVFCPKEETFTFLQDVLTEVMALFPGPYIHIGGDECPKERWKACAHCQAVKKREGLKDEHELQSYFIKRIERFVNERGRRIIGWDEIMEGGLAPNATVMSWRGTEGGTEAARSGHDAVMCPGGHCYFDHYQGDPAHEPLAIGGFTTVQKVYGYEPVPEALTPVEAKHIIGAQGNVWTEYILTPEHVEYMALPRMAALAEVLWTPKERRDEGAFIRRLEQEFSNLDALDVNYSKSLYNVEFSTSGSKKRGQVNTELSAAPGLGEIHYTTDGSEPVDTSARFVSTIEQRGNTTIKAALFGGNKKLGNTTSLTLVFDNATGKALQVAPRPDERYDDGGIFTLVNGVSAGAKRVNHEWLGWRTGRVTVTLDLGGEEALEHAGIGGLEERNSWIHPPERVTIATSSDGLSFTDVATVRPDPAAKGRMEFGTDLGGRTARHVRFTVEALPAIPEGFPGAGNLPWLFLDEVHVR